jgi:hypothetical protein
MVRLINIKNINSLFGACAFSQMCNNHGASFLLQTLAQAAFRRIEESWMLNGNVIGFPLRAGR